MVPPYNVHVKTTIWQQIISITCSLVLLNGCISVSVAPQVATPTPLVAAEVLGAHNVATLQPVRLTQWQSNDGRLTMQVPQEWALENHMDAGRGLWIWNAPGQRGLLSLMLIGSPTYVDDATQTQLLRDAIDQLAAQPIDDIRRVDANIVVVEATSQGSNREGTVVPMRVWMSAHRFADGVAIVVMSVPDTDKDTVASLIPLLQTSLTVVPLPTVTPLPSATPAPYTKDSFDNETGRWFVGDDLRRAITVNDGVYRLYLRMAESYYLSAPAETPRLNQRLQTRVLFDGNARVGVALRFQYRPDDTRDYVACWISQQQRFGCFRSDGDQWQVVYDISESTAILVDAPNLVALAVVDDVYTLTVNDNEIASFEAKGMDQGVPALYVETFNAAAGGIFDDVETS